MPTDFNLHRFKKKQYLQIKKMVTALYNKLLNLICQILQHLCYLLYMCIKSQNGYTEPITYGRSGAGIVVQIHASYEPAQPQINGLTMGVGSWASIPIHQKYVNKF